MALSKIYSLVTWIRSFSPSVSCQKVEQRIQSNNKWEVLNSLITNFEFLFFTLSGSKTFLRWFNFLQTEWIKCFKFGSVSSFIFIKPAEQGFISCVIHLTCVTWVALRHYLQQKSDKKRLRCWIFFSLLGCIKICFYLMITLKNCD